MGGKVDLVVCADCVNEPMYGNAWLGLVDCLEAFCGPQTIAYVAVQRRKGDGLEDFLDRLGRQLLVESYFSRSTGGSEVLVYCVRRPSRSEGFVKMLNREV